MNPDDLLKSYPCPHCGQPQPTPPPGSLRRCFVLIIGLELLLLVALVSQGPYGLPQPDSAPSLISFLLWVWGVGYTNYLWISFLLIGSLRLPGCEFVAISHALSKLNIHRCVDSVLNSVLDEKQRRRGLSLRLLGTESAQKWTVGILLLTIFLSTIWSHVLGRPVENLAVGVFSTVYFIYDKTVHRVSIGRRDLTGSGDYTRILADILWKKKH